MFKGVLTASRMLIFIHKRRLIIGNDMSSSPIDTSALGASSATEHTPTRKYSLTSRALHWGSAALIIWATLSGLSISLFSIPDGIAHHIADFNVSATLVFIPFFIWRVLYRLRHGSPSYDGVLDRHSSQIVVAVHYVLYALTGAVLLSGVFMMKTSFSLFGLLELEPLLSSPQLLHSSEVIHIATTRLLGILVVLHVLAVIKHHLALRPVLKRML